MKTDTYGACFSNLNSVNFSSQEFCLVQKNISPLVGRDLKAVGKTCNNWITAIPLLVESLIRVMYRVAVTILNSPFKPLNINSA